MRPGVEVRDHPESSPDRGAQPGGVGHCPLPGAATLHGADPSTRGQRGRRRIGARVDLPTFALHWLVAVAATTSFVTGMRIAADARGAGWSRLVAPLAPSGGVHQWHAWAAMALAAAALAYAVYLRASRSAGRLRPSRHPTALRRFNVLLYWLAFALLALMLVTGLPMYLGISLPPAIGLADLHRYAAWALALYVPLHVGAQLAAGGLRGLARILLPRRTTLIAGLATAMTAAAAATVLLLADRFALGTLELQRVAAAPLLDGDSGDAAWQSATPVEVHTTGGANLPGGAATVSVRGVHDGETAYFLFSWPDRTRSLKMMPLIKTADGWRVLQSGFMRSDENEYYEDKFAVMLAQTPRIAGAGSVRLGKRPLDDRPPPGHGRGFHVTGGDYVDVWQWKAVRTGASMGLADDSHFGPPLEPYAVDPHYWGRAPAPGHEEGLRRYTGGYEKDWKTGGGFAMNWEVFDEERVTPRWLPSDRGYLLRLGGVDLSPAVSDRGSWWLQTDESIPYTEAADVYAEGTVLPSVLIKGPMMGDRADVRAVGRWHEGRWQVEMSRRLAVTSKHDVAITDGVYLWVAVFDHTQTRHSYHLRPLRVTLATQPASSALVARHTHW